MATTWPLATALGSKVPLGQEPVATVPYFNLYSLRWTADRLPHLLSGWWDPPIFWPNRGLYAASELQPLTGAVFAAIRPVLGDTGAYGSILLVALALNGIWGAALARRLGADHVPAALAGLLAQTVPFAFDQLGVLQLVMLWPLFAALTMVIAWAAEPTGRRALFVGLALAAAVGTCGYHGLLFSMAVALPAVVLVGRSWIDDARLRLAGVAAGAGVAVALTAPFLMGQQQRLDVRWTDETILAGSARWAALGPGGQHWPGWALLTLALGGFVVGVRRRTTWFLLAVGVIASVSAVGSHLSLLGWRPWVMLTDHVTAVARMRSPFRATAVAQVALVGLAALAIQWCWVSPRRVLRAAVAVTAVVAAVAGSSGGPGRLVPLPSRSTAASAWLQEHDDDAPVVALPYAPGPQVEDFEATTAAMLQSLDHRHPLLNGYTGFFPASHDLMQLDLAGFPDRRSIATLARTGIRYAIVDPDWYLGYRATGGAAFGLVPLAEDEAGILLALPLSAP